MTVYRIAPASRRDFDLAGPGNEWLDLGAACEAADSLDASMPLGPGDEWCVYGAEGDRGPWVNLTREDQRSANAPADVDDLPDPGEVADDVDPDPAPRRRGGRPPLDPNDRESVVFAVRLTRSTMREVRGLASMRGTTAPALVREAIEFYLDATAEGAE